MSEENKYLSDLNERLKSLIINTCNKIGCDNCGLSWGKECSATDLQDKIHKEQFKDIRTEKKNNF